MGKRSATPPAAPASTDGALKHVLPFSYLSEERRRAVEKVLVFVSFEPREVVISRNDGGEQDEDELPELFVAVSGAFVVVDDDGVAKTDTHMGPGTIFGERAALFGVPRTQNVRAVSGQHSAAWCMPGNVLLDLLQEHNPRFALALATNLRHKQGIFDQFLSFRAFVFAGVLEPGGHSVNMRELVERYKRLEPAIHSLANNRRVIDYDGWKYALRRLPANITSVYSLVCSRRVINVLKVRGEVSGDDWSDQVPVTTSAHCVTACSGKDKCSSAEELDFVVSSLSPGRPVATEDRRRTCWEVMPGKVFVLLRELVSDYLDIVTNLCVHAIEAAKLGSKLRPRGMVVPVLQQGIRRMEGKSLEEKRAITDDVLQSIASDRLEARDIEKLPELWPDGDTLHHVLSTIIHHGDYSVFLDSTSNAYTTSADERWCDRVRALAVELIGPFENCSSCDLAVDVVSSNTHSVLNCLSPYLQSHREQILAWGRKNTDLFDGDLRTEADRLYAVARPYFEAHPKERERANEMERKSGIYMLQEREVTGVSVQLYDLNRIKESGHGFDELLGAKAQNRVSSRRHLLINIDYCFGSQAEHILRMLILTFGYVIRSVNILGKAGGLVGQRGDILYPTHVLDENQGGEMRALDNCDIDAQHLHEMSGRCVHIGPIITVLGTVLQSRELLRFYERLWHATGMEMEASWYMRAIEEGMLLGILPPDVRARLLYYVSDTPLVAEKSLAAKMTVLEGIPPLYSITRVILRRVLDPGDPDKPDPCEGQSKATNSSRKSSSRWNKLRSAVRATSRPNRTVVRETIQ